MLGLKKWFPHPVTAGTLYVELPHQVVQFPTPDDFSFACAARSGLPLERIRWLLELPRQEFDAEEKSVRLLEQRFISMLSLSDASADSLGHSMQAIPISNFSKDHHWRKIMLALSRAELRQVPQLNEFRRIALTKYLQYLAARREVLQMLGRLRAASGDFSIAVQDGGRSSDQPADLPVMAEKNYERLPKGEGVTLVLKEGDRLDLILSRHKCKLYSDKELTFTGTEIAPSVLRHGRNAIGRDYVNDVILDSAWRDISRLHLIVENMGNGIVQLTDMSSHGTYMPIDWLKNRDMVKH